MNERTFTLSLNNINQFFKDKFNQINHKMKYSCDELERKRIKKKNNNNNKIMRKKTTNIEIENLQWI